MAVTLWRLDVGDITGAIKIVCYALRLGLSMSENHSRLRPYVPAEKIAFSSLILHVVKIWIFKEKPFISIS